MANPPRPGRPQQGPSAGFQGPFRYLWLVALVGLMALVFVGRSFDDFNTTEIPYSELKDHLREGHVERVVLTPEVVRAVPQADKVKPPEGKDKPPEMWIAMRVRDDEALIPLLDEAKIPYEARPDSGCGDGATLLFWMLPLFVLFWFWSSILGRAGGGAGPQAMTFGKSKHRLYAEEGTGVTFSDVAGCDEAKEELREIVDFLKAPERFSRLGGKLPKGVMLVGPPGTGKTLLAKAVAGEAGVTFFNISGSDFVEMFVGVGAARVRDLFQQAQEKAPCIIFVDELDAIGKSRGINAVGGNDEREQTLNALLVEMDGFDARSGVILLAATNRPEILDPALLRPGRFDRQVLVDRPDLKGRLAILKIHARAVKMSPEVDLERIAAQTPGFVGADLANIVNEAALLAARADKQGVDMSDLAEAVERVVAGLEKKNRRLNPKEQRIIAFHESGHAIAAAALPEADTVLKISIIPRGIGALGYTYQVPLEDRYLMTRTELLVKMCTLLGGRAAEELVFGDVSTGASNDLERVADLARRMITQFGMSHQLPNVSLERDRGRGGFLGDFGPGQRDYSEATAEAIDQETRQLIERAYQTTRQLLIDNMALLHDMSQHLLEHEILEGEQLKEFLARATPSAPPEPPPPALYPPAEAPDEDAPA